MCECVRARRDRERERQCLCVECSMYVKESVCECVCVGERGDRKFVCGVCMYVKETLCVIERERACV